MDQKARAFERSLNKCCEQVSLYFCPKVEHVVESEVVDETAEENEEGDETPHFSFRQLGRHHKVCSNYIRQTKAIHDHSVVKLVEEWTKISPQVERILKSEGDKKNLDKLIRGCEREKKRLESAMTRGLDRQAQEAYTILDKSVHEIYEHFGNSPLALTYLESIAHVMDTYKSGSKEMTEAQQARKEKLQGVRAQVELLAKEWNSAKKQTESALDAAMQQYASETRSLARHSTS
eukprot:Colp12_sorted_trinity150504_noHs@8921